MRTTLGTLLLALACGACLDTHVEPLPDVELVTLCEYIAECAPVQTRGVDWGVLEECEAAVVDVAACALAWREVLCLPDDATLEDVMASTPSVQRAVSACLGEDSP